MRFEAYQEIISLKNKKSIIDHCKHMSEPLAMMAVLVPIKTKLIRLLETKDMDRPFINFVFQVAATLPHSNTFIDYVVLNAISLIKLYRIIKIDGCEIILLGEIIRKNRLTENIHIPPIEMICNSNIVEWNTFVIAYNVETRKEKEEENKK
jgi:hypothetical protein